MATTYSGKDSTIVFTHPLVPPLIASGVAVGLNQAHVSMATEKTVHSVATDGAVMISAIAGDNGSIALEMQQTSALHAQLMGWYNAIKVLLDQGNVLNWATAAVTIRNVVDGSYHEATGVSPSKIPDKVYAAQGQNLTWNLMCADIQSTVVA